MYIRLGVYRRFAVSAHRIIRSNVHKIVPIRRARKRATRADSFLTSSCNLSRSRNTVSRLNCRAPIAYFDMHFSRSSIRACRCSVCTIVNGIEQLEWLERCSERDGA